MIHRGTTPHIVFSFPQGFPMTTIEKVLITFWQFGEEVYTFGENEVEMGESEISINMTQEQTLKLTAGVPLVMQIRVLVTGGCAMVSNIMKDAVGPILKEGVIE